MKKAGKLGCTHPRVVRRGRVGLLDAVMYRFGRYPWTCRMCGSRMYFKDRRPGRSGSAVRAADTAAPGPTPVESFLGQQNQELSPGA